MFNKYLQFITILFVCIFSTNLNNANAIDLDDDKRFIENTKGTIQRLQGDFNSDDLYRQEITSDIIASYTRDLTFNFLNSFGRLFDETGSSQSVLH